MAKKKSAQRRNKQFKSVDPFRRGKSTQGLGTGSDDFYLSLLKGSFLTPRLSEGILKFHLVWAFPERHLRPKKLRKVINVKFESL